MVFRALSGVLHWLETVRSGYIYVVFSILSYVTIFGGFNIIFIKVFFVFCYAISVFVMQLAYCLLILTIISPFRINVSYLIVSKTFCSVFSKDSVLINK